MQMFYIDVSLINSNVKFKPKLEKATQFIKVKDDWCGNWGKFHNYVRISVWIPCERPDRVHITFEGTDDLAMHKRFDDYEDAYVFLKELPYKIWMNYLEKKGFTYD